MSCGCANNQSNKNITDKQLKLEDIKNMSIDDIINLYREGYRIESMALSYPNIIDATAYYDGSNTYPLILWTNSGSYGYVVLVVYDQNGFWKTQIESCMETRVGLKYLTRLSITGLTTPLLDIYASKCASDTDQNCATSPVSCTRVQRTSTFSGIPVRARDTTTPAAPSGLTITPGDGRLTIAWNAVTNTEIFAYFLSVVNASTRQIADFGYLANNERSITIFNLVNGTQYEINVRAINHSYVNGALSTTTGTPAPAAPPPPPVSVLTSVEILPTTVSMVVGGTQQFTAKAKDQNGNEIAGATITWNISDPTKGSLSTTTGSTTVFTLTAFSTTAITLTATATFEGVTKSGTSIINVTEAPVQTCQSLSLTVPSSAKRDESVTLVAIITPSIAGFDISGFNVEFKDGTTILATVSTDVSGKASYTYRIPSDAILGIHTITAKVPYTACEDSKSVEITEAPVTAGIGTGVVVAAAAAAIALAYFATKKSK